MKNPKFLIIIPVRNRCDVLLETIESMKFLSGNEEVKLVVVDDASTDDTAQKVRERFPFVELVVNESPRGPSYSRNRGASLYEPEYYVFLDSDIEVPGEWMSAVHKHASPNHVIAGKVVNYYNREVEVGPRCATFLGGSIPCPEHQANVGSSCNLVVPYACFKAIDGFDEEIPYYFEDSDFCIRARRAGFPVKYVDEVVVYHKHSGYKTGKRIEMHVQNRTYAMSKAYEKKPAKLALFFLLNSAWVFVQSFIRSLKLQFGDSLAILRGWIKGNRKFMQRVLKRQRLSVSGSAAQSR